MAGEFRQRAAAGEAMTWRPLALGALLALTVAGGAIALALATWPWPQ